VHAVIVNGDGVMSADPVELLAHQVIDRVQAGQPAEDDALIELKADWPDPVKAARRVAAHANGARRERILWLIGVDEKASRIPGVLALDVSPWWDQVRAHFESNGAPGLRVINIRHDDVTVVALEFETAGAPFMVRHGDRWEVPWREGTQTRSARRSELLQILSPIVRRPDYELQRGTLRHRIIGTEVSSLTFALELMIYITPQSSDTVVLPYHRMKSALFAPSGKEVFEFDDFSGSIPRRQRPDEEPSSEAAGLIRVTDSEVIVSGPGNVVLKATGAGDWVETDEIEESCEVRFLVRPAGGVAETKLRQTFTRVQSRAPDESTWLATWGPVSFLPEPSGL